MNICSWSEAQPASNFTGSELSAGVRRNIGSTQSPIMVSNNVSMFPSVSSRVFLPECFGRCLHLALLWPQCWTAERNACTSWSNPGTGRYVCLGPWGELPGRQLLLYNTILYSLNRKPVKSSLCARKMPLSRVSHLAFSTHPVAWLTSAALYYNCVYIPVLLH